MGAPKGNKYHLNRLMKAGRKRRFETPEQLAKEASEYFDKVDANPYLKKDPIKSGELAGSYMHYEVQRPYLIEDLCLHLGVSQDTLRNYSTKEQYEEFFVVAKAIYDAISSNKKEGALLGYFNAGLVARMEGIGDKTTVEHQGEQQQNVIQLGDVKFNV